MLQILLKTGLRSLIFEIKPKTKDQRPKIENKKAADFDRFRCYKFRQMSSENTPFSPIDTAARVFLSRVITRLEKEASEKQKAQQKS
ncbi:MAG: hypothetical protein JSS81_06370 [Acidobacteria bacterium]|nr:hypothetical protein [Acidobacteriota bacterium]